MSFFGAIVLFRRIPAQLSLAQQPPSQKWMLRALQPEGTFWERVGDQVDVYAGRTLLEVSCFSEQGVPSG